MTEDEMMREYVELCGRGNLWPAEVFRVRWLAHRLGRRVEFVKESLYAAGK